MTEVSAGHSARCIFSVRLHAESQAVEATGL
jgi:hypothetical protein